MAMEAQRLIGISLAKIAQSRVHRGGVSLHKNLLVATVLQKARYIFMEEAYHMIHGGGYSSPVSVNVPVPQQNQRQRPYEDSNNYNVDNLVALTAEEAGLSSTKSVDEAEESATADFMNPVCDRCSETDDKENRPPITYGNTELTYTDLDKSSLCSDNLTIPVHGNKRRRAVTEWETEEAVLSILPKKSKQESVDDIDDDDSVFLDEAAIFSNCIAREVSSTGDGLQRKISIGDYSKDCSSSMEIDRITSLVSIFSFGGSAVAASSGDAKLSRSISTPDLCSSQAKEGDNNLQQRSFLAMTV